ncbi:MAG: glycosyltransferase [Caldilineaceae bacterium]
MNEGDIDPADATRQNATVANGRRGPARLLRIARALWRGDPVYRQRLLEVLDPITGAVRRRIIAVVTTAKAWSHRKADWVYVSGESDTPGHIYRVQRYAEAARAAGGRTRIVRIQDCRGKSWEFASARVVILWRVVWSEKVASILKVARAAGAHIVYDVDDLIFVPRLARIALIDGIRTQGIAEETAAACYGQIRRVLVSADLCTTTTDELAQHAQRAGIPTFVLPNGFDDATFSVARAAARRWAARCDRALLRIGYASGSRTHQRDFAVCASAVAKVLRERPNVRLVLFHLNCAGQPLVDLREFPDFEGLEGRVEWRDLVPLERLPEEVARFDVNLAPLEVGNPFCEAKSELKYFEAALAGVCTIASPTGPFSRAIRHGETGFLAESPKQWLDALNALLDDGRLRKRMACAALRDVLWFFGPDRRAQLMRTLLSMLRDGHDLTPCLPQKLQTDARKRCVRLRGHRTSFQSDRFGVAYVTIVVHLFNGGLVIEEALNSVRLQTLAIIDLIVVDDASRDDSAEVAKRWAKSNASRFNRLLILQNFTTAGRRHTRDLGFAEADTPYVLPLDGDKRLFPLCAQRCLESIRATRAAVAVQSLRELACNDDLSRDRRYNTSTLPSRNDNDCIALISKAAWAAVGGYEDVRSGCEDLDFRRKLANRRLFGLAVSCMPQAE